MVRSRPNPQARARPGPRRGRSRRCALLRDRRPKGGQSSGRARCHRAYPDHAAGSRPAGSMARVRGRSHAGSRIRLRDGQYCGPGPAQPRAGGDVAARSSTSWSTPRWTKAPPSKASCRPSEPPPATKPKPSPRPAASTSPPCAPGPVFELLLDRGCRSSLAGPKATRGRRAERGLVGHHRRHIA